MSCGPHGSFTHAAVYALDENIPSPPPGNVLLRGHVETVPTPMKGLYNDGINFCFANSVIQCILAVEKHLHRPLLPDSIRDLLGTNGLKSEFHHQAYSNLTELERTGRENPFVEYIKNPNNTDQQDQQEFYAYFVNMLLTTPKIKQTNSIYWNLKDTPTLTISKSETEVEINYIKMEKEPNEKTFEIDFNPNEIELKGENQYEVVKEIKVDAIREERFTFDPNHMVMVHLIRKYGHSQLVSNKLESPSFRVLLPIQLKDGSRLKKLYHLVGFTQFRGTASAGHYISYVTHDTNNWFIKRKWWKCDDETVTAVSDIKIKKEVGIGMHPTMKKFLKLYKDMVGFTLFSFTMLPSHHM